MGDREPSAPLDNAVPEHNAVLEQLLWRAKWTPENLGDHLNALAASLDLKVHVNRRYPRRWVYPERGRTTPRTPREPLPSLVCRLLSQRLGEPVTPGTLGWPTARGPVYVPADDGLRHNWDARGAIAALGEVVDPDGMERRHFMVMTGLTLTAVAHQWLLDPARVAASVLGKRVDHQVVHDLEQVVEARRRLDDDLGGGSLLPGTREDLRLVVALLRNSSYTEDVGQRLHAVAAEFARLAAWLAFDSNQPALAQRYFVAALRSAHVSSDRAIGANILGYMSLQAAKSNSPKDAVVLAESALNGARGLTPAVEASLHARLARGAAGVGDAATWERAQNHAFNLLAGSVPENEPPWIYWFNDADAHGIAGSALLALDQPSQAVGHLRRAVSIIDPSCSRDRVVWLCKLATARVGAGSIEQGCVTASEAASALKRLQSPRTKQFLVDFRRAANAYSNSSVVRNFDAKYEDLMRDTSV